MGRTGTKNQQLIMTNFLFMSYLKNHPINNDWFISGITPDAIVYADSFAKHLSEESKGRILPLTTSQLRKFFGAVKTLELKIRANGFEENKSDFIMLKPKLAYAVGRVRNANRTIADIRISDLEEVLSLSIDIIMSKCSNKDFAFKNFIKFFEAIVAYHKSYGKDK